MQRKEQFNGATYTYQRPVRSVQLQRCIHVQGNWAIILINFAIRREAIGRTPCQKAFIKQKRKIVSTSHQQVSKSQLLLSNDRGTPMICNNRLAGVLSEIIPANNSTGNGTCTESLKTKAYFTKVSPHVDWVHSIMGVNLPAEPLRPIDPPFSGNSIFIRISSFIAQIIICNFVRRILCQAQPQPQSDPQNHHAVLPTVCISTTFWWRCHSLALSRGLCRLINILFRWYREKLASRIIQLYNIQKFTCQSEQCYLECLENSVWCLVASCRHRVDADYGWMTWLFRDLWYMDLAYTLRTNKLW